MKTFTTRSSTQKQMLVKLPWHFIQACLHIMDGTSLLQDKILTILCNHQSQTQVMCPGLAQMCLEKYLCPYVKMAQMHSICSKFSHLVNVIDSNFGNFLIFHVQNSTCNGSVTCSGHIILRCMYIVHVNAPGQVNNLWSFFKCCVHVCLSS